MHPADKKRLEREAELHRAKRGPDYSMHESEVAACKSEMQRREVAVAEHLKRFRAALAAGELDEGIDL